MTTYSKSYETKDEFIKRLEVFKQAKAKIDARNSQNGLTYRLGVNKFADWTKEEYRTLLKYKKQSGFLSFF